MKKKKTREFGSSKNAMVGLAVVYNIFKLAYCSKNK